MSVALRQADPREALSRAHAALDELSGLDLTGMDDEELLDYWRELERLERRLPSLGHGLVSEAQARALPEKHHVRNIAQFLRGLLRLDPAEAHARVKAAESCGQRRAMSGQPLPANYPLVAAAQAAGAISARHARVVVDTVNALPDEVRDEHGDQLEADLVGFAEVFDPQQLGKLARRASDCLDPDGKLKDDAYRERSRGLTACQRSDGSGRIEGELTAECMELLLVHLDALAGPKPEVDGIKDPRTAAQRRHDALLEALKLNVRARQLPSVAGVTATVVLTMTQEQYETGKGLARTGHGALVPTRHALAWAGGDVRLMAVVIDKIKGITAYSSLQRLFTEGQRLALAAVDGGCTFPNCSVPAHWCEVDHCTDYAKGGPTRVDRGVLACRYDHRERKKQGWRSTRINGRAAWIPPRWIDPEQQPRYNFVHNPDPP